jgi:hypothetical protein
MARGGDPLSSAYPVESANDLIAVVTHLWMNLRAHPEDWENPTLESFLQAMAAWLASFPQVYVNNEWPIPQPDWRFVADALRAARIYE